MLCFLYLVRWEPLTLSEYSTLVLDISLITPCPTSDPSIRQFILFGPDEPPE